MQSRLIMSLLVRLMALEEIMGLSYKNDFIELYNPTSNPISLDGYSLQYAAKTGAFSIANTTNLSGTIPANGYYLIQEAAGAGTQPQFLNTPDVSGSIAMSGTDGKVALVHGTTAITGKSDPSVVDFVGYGGANEFEGSASIKITSNANSAQRRPYANVDPAPGKGNAWDTDDNAADFYVGLVATPRNSASPTEAPMVPVTSLQPQGINIQFLQQGTSVTVKGAAEAAEPESTIKVYENASKGTALSTATANGDGSFTISFDSSISLSSVFVAATQSGLDESAAIQIDKAAASAFVEQAKLSYVVNNGVGTLIGGAGSATANSTINVYPNDTVNAAERLNGQAFTASSAGDFSVPINNAPNTVYVTQLTS
jgi:hypothetical protein